MAPPTFASIRTELEAEQEADGGADADVDYLFDVPVRVAASLTGYKHDEESPAFEAADDEGLEVLETTAVPAIKSWLGRLLGR